MAIGFPDFFRYNLWANLRLLDACAHLTDAQLDATMTGTYGSARQTLMHLISAEEGYAKHAPGSALTPQLMESDEFPGFDDLRRRAEHAGNRLIAFAEQGDLGRVLHRTGEPMTRRL